MSAASIDLHTNRPHRRTSSISSGSNFTFTPTKIVGAVEIVGRNTVGDIQGTIKNETISHLDSATITMPIDEYNALIDELELLQDSLDAIAAKAQIASEGSKRKDWATFLAELEADGLLD